MLEETGTKVYIATVKRVLYQHNLKGRSARRHCSKTAIKKPDYSWHLHMGTTIVLFGEMYSGLMKQKQNCLAIMTIVMFGGKRGRLAAGGTGALHKIDGIMRQGNYVDILKQPLKTTFRKLKLGRKQVFQMDIDPKHTSKGVAKWLKDNKVKVLEWPSQSP